MARVCFFAVLLAMCCAIGAQAASATFLHSRTEPLGTDEPAGPDIQNERKQLLQQLRAWMKSVAPQEHRTNSSTNASNSSLAHNPKNTSVVQSRITYANLNGLPLKLTKVVGFKVKSAIQGLKRKTRHQEQRRNAGPNHEAPKQVAAKTDVAKKKAEQVAKVVAAKMDSIRKAANEVPKQVIAKMDVTKKKTEHVAKVVAAKMDITRKAANEVTKNVSAKMDGAEALAEGSGFPKTAAENAAKKYLKHLHHRYGYLPEVEDDEAEKEADGMEKDLVMEEDKILEPPPALPEDPPQRADSDEDAQRKAIYAALTDTLGDIRDQKAMPNIKVSQEDADSANLGYQARLAVQEADAEIEKAIDSDAPVHADIMKTLDLGLASIRGFYPNHVSSTKEIADSQAAPVRHGVHPWAAIQVSPQQDSKSSQSLEENFKELTKAFEADHVAELNPEKADDYSIVPSGIAPPTEEEKAADAALANDIVAKDIVVSEDALANEEAADTQEVGPRQDSQPSEFDE